VKTVYPPVSLRSLGVYDSIFTGCLDPENVWLAIGIAFLSALDPKLQAILINSAAILESNVSDTGSSK